MIKNNFKKEKRGKEFTPTPTFRKQHCCASIMTHSESGCRGFTLIELMVATSIFIIVILSSMGALFTLLDTAKNSRALRFAMDNVNFAMESMTRSIRMGTNYYCGISGTSIPGDLTLTQDCNGEEGGTLISFVPQGTTYRITYKLAQIGTTGKYTLERCKDNSCVSIMSPDVNLKRLQFFVRGSGDDNNQASVYIMMKGTVMVKEVPTSFAVQTMASQRNF